MNIQMLILKWCEEATHFLGYSPQTIKRYKVVVNKFLSFTGIEDLQDVTRPVVADFFLHHSVNSKWKPNTFITYHKTLNVFFRWCVKQGFMTENPVEYIAIPKIPMKIPPRLKREQAMYLLDTAYNYPYQERKGMFLASRNHAIIAMFIHAGLRRAELINLKFTDVDIERKTIFVRQGKGAKDRIIPMSHRLAVSLLRYLDERQRKHKTCPEFFTLWKENQGISVTAVRRLVELLKKATKIDFSPHMLRHTFATLMLEGGCDIYSLSKMMGHSDIKTTTIYLAASAEHLREQMMKHPLNDIV